MKKLLQSCSVNCTIGWPSCFLLLNVWDISTGYQHISEDKFNKLIHDYIYTEPYHLLMWVSVNKKRHFVFIIKYYSMNTLPEDPSHDKTVVVISVNHIIREKKTRPSMLF